MFQFPRRRRAGSIIAASLLCLGALSTSALAARPAVETAVATPARLPARTAQTTADPASQLPPQGVYDSCQPASSPAA
jgi:hypothetical protein